MSIKKYFVADIPRRKFLEMGLKGGVVVAAAPSMMMHLLSCKGSVPEQSGLAIDPGMLNRTIQKALGKGGEFADVYVEHRISRRILLEESKFKSAVFGISQGAGVRVISGDRT